MQIPGYGMPGNLVCLTLSRAFASKRHTSSESTTSSTMPANLLHSYQLQIPKPLITVAPTGQATRSEESRVVKEGVSTCVYRRTPYQKKKQHTIQTTIPDQIQSNN